MKRLVGGASLIALALVGAALMLPRLLRNPDHDFAESICHPTMFFNRSDHEASFEECMPRKFGNGTPISKLERYALAADFRRTRTIVRGAVHEDTYMAVQDWSKGPREKRILVSYSNGRIVHLAASEWLDNWPADGRRPKSPFSP